LLSSQTKKEKKKMKFIIIFSLFICLILSTESVPEWIKIYIPKENKFIVFEDFAR
jgi:hypothetical protein